MQTLEPDREKQRVAVIAVHGVADQREGETAQAVARMLEQAGRDGAHYDTAREQQAFLLKVEPVRPLRSVPRADKPKMLTKAWWKKYRLQSYGSDFHRKDWAVDTHGTKDSIAVDRPPTSKLGPGPDLTEFMLFKASSNMAATESWRSQALSLPRRDAAGVKQVDIYEMYWADLSRLGGGLPRVASELFTLLFRLSALGRDTVRIALAANQFGGAAWGALRRLQTALDWQFSRVLALLTLQLLMLALVILPMGLLTGHEKLAASLITAGVSFGGYVLFCYAEWPRWLRRDLIAVCVAGVAVGFGALAWFCPRSEWWVGAAWLAALTAAYVPFVRAIDARFPFTGPIAWGMWAAVLVGLSSWAIVEWKSYYGLTVWTIAALRMLELLLAAIVVAWGFIGATMLAWFIAGIAASRAGTAEAHAIVSTGRLGVFASGSFFLLLGMVLWALVSNPLETAVGAHGYAPLLFAVDGFSPSGTLAKQFLDARYRGSTELFPLIALIDLLLVAYLVVFFLPSVLVELRARSMQLDAGRLGRWLSTGYDHLDTHPIRWLSFMSVVAGVAGAGYLVWWLLHRLYGLDMPPPTSEVLTLFSQKALAPFVIGAGSLTLALSAFGGVLSRYLPGLRAPLDIALDVDNHFREFPRKAIPRARIVARYMALLRHLDTQQYDRIVIVAHSQGTVITTELLRYMRRRLEVSADDAEAQFVARLAAKTDLVTLGCPLLQLYAARFPTLYPWVLQEGGPKARDLGVQRWINGYATGDYVGRWLWHADARRYEAGTRKALRADLEAGVNEIDVCLGSGAHTHYFDADDHGVDPSAARVSVLVDELIGAASSGLTSPAWASVKSSS